MPSSSEPGARWWSAPLQSIRRRQMAQVAGFLVVAFIVGISGQLDAPFADP
jgi:hypothetical protein